MNDEQLFGLERVKHRMRKRTRALLWRCLFVSVLAVSGSGCLQSEGSPTTLAGAEVSEFVRSFARNALAAFLF